MRDKVARLRQDLHEQGSPPGMKMVIFRGEVALLVVFLMMEYIKPGT
jgi:hypothetical protein